MKYRTLGFGFLCVLKLNSTCENLTIKKQYKLIHLNICKALSVLKCLRIYLLQSTLLWQPLDYFILFLYLEGTLYNNWTQRSCN